MLTRILAHDVEPMGDLEISFRPRLNLLCGDNGLGKTFVLDLAWWGLTGTWSRHPAIPRSGEEVRPNLRADSEVPQQAAVRDAGFNFSSQRWDRGAEGLPAHLVLKAGYDGAFDLSDPFRSVLTTGVTFFGSRKNRLSFAPEEVWNGVTADGGAVLSNGLLRDLVTWQFQKPALFDLFGRVLAKLSPGPSEVLKLGAPQRISIEDARDIPTLALPYGAVPITHASAGMRRILALAYMLVWTWHEHTEAARLRNSAPLNDLVVLIDEVEAHLHPQWQRAILPALFTAIADIQDELAVQVLAATHAPLVLASVETLFDEERDQLLHFSLSGSKIQIETLPFAKQGDAVNWLVSETFGLEQARSREAERAIEAAEAFMRGAPPPPDLDTQEKIHAELLRVLPGHDDFWPRWLVRTGAVK